MEVAATFTIMATFMRATGRGIRGLEKASLLLQTEESSLDHSRMMKLMMGSWLIPMITNSRTISIRADSSFVESLMALEPLDSAIQLIMLATSRTA
jgi:hypothetical protein